jgi:hypothetical protein
MAVLNNQMVYVSKCREELSENRFNWIGP